MIWGSIPGKSRGFFSFPQSPDWLWCPWSPLWSGYPCLLPPWKIGRGLKLIAYFNPVPRLKVPIHVRVWLGSGPNEANSSVWGATSRARQGLRWGSARRRLAIGSYVCGLSRARLGTMSASMSKTFMSRFCGRFAAQIIRTVQSGMRPGIYSCSSRERKSLMLTCVLLRKEWTVSGHHLGKNCPEFGIVVLSPLLQLAAMNSLWVLKCTSEVRSPLMHVW
jgi:hypothetical protein